MREPGGGMDVVRRAWILEARYRLLAYGFGVRTDLPDVARIVPQLLGSGGADRGRAARTYALLHDGARENPFVVRTEEGDLFRTATSLGLVDEMLWHVNREAIASTDHLAIHAAAAERDGAAVVLPARQDSGKSTTVAGLVRAGFGYLTDEAALIEHATLEIVPYPKPLWLSPPSVLAIEGLDSRVIEDYRALDRIRTYVRPGDLDGSNGSPSPVRLVVSPRYVPGRPTSVEPLSRAATLMCLAENAFNLRERGSVGMETLRGVAEGAPGFRLTFSDLQEAVGAVIHLLSDVTR